MKTGLILEGGAVRGIFTAGVLDRLMENGIYLPYVIGVSAGGTNALSYRARQMGRTARLMNAPKAETYYGFRQFFSSHKLIDLDKMCYEYPYKQFPLDFDTYFGSEIQSEYACTCCETGEVEFMSEGEDENRLMTICKATCSIPMLCEPVELDGRLTMRVRVRFVGGDENTTVAEFELFEGRNRQIRRMCELHGVRILRLQRVAIGKLKLGDLPEGKWRHLSQSEIEYLKK